jgi:thiamine-phosphate pyrophosphorylase
MKPAARISGLYALTPDWADSAKLLNCMRAALAGGVRLVQYRNKCADPALKKTQATALLSLCREFGATLIINDDVVLALAIDADGVHIGAEDASLAQARTQLGPKKLIGVSCYNKLQLALESQSQGADYVAFGSFFSSPTKPGAVAAPLSLLSDAKSQLHIPVVAIGGITLDNAPALIEAGADAVAIISALFDSANIRATANTFGELFKPISIHSNQSVSTL